MKGDRDGRHVLERLVISAIFSEFKLKEDESRHLLTSGMNRSLYRAVN